MMKKTGKREQNLYLYHIVIGLTRFFVDRLNERPLSRAARYREPARLRILQRKKINGTSYKASMSDR